jgi:hypothetical protein
METTKKLGHPAFILSVLMLIINDWYLKQNFHNEITGKLSDFAGLFSLPFLLSSFYPKWNRHFHISISVFFIIWKSTFSQPAIDLMNLLGLPVHRTVDVTDNVALMSILFSYYLFNRPSAVVLPTFLTKLMIVIASFAFIATTLPSRKLRKYEAINKQYTFGFPKRELVSRLNMLQLKEIYNLNK